VICEGVCCSSARKKIVREDKEERMFITAPDNNLKLAFEQATTRSIRHHHGCE